MSLSLSPCPAEVQVDRIVGKADYITVIMKAVRREVPVRAAANGVLVSIVIMSGIWPTRLGVEFR